MEALHADINGYDKDLGVLGPSAASRLAQTFKVLGDPTRLRIISALSSQELCVNDLAEALEMSHSAVSHQLQILRLLHLVRARKAGRQVFYALDDEHVLSLFEQGLRHVNHT